MKKIEKKIVTRPDFDGVVCAVLLIEAENGNENIKWTEPNEIQNNEVEITVHADSIHIGSLFDGDLLCMEKLCELITKGDIPCEKTDSIEKDLWAKMLYNCALNPLGAILDVPYGVLAEK